MSKNVITHFKCEGNMYCLVLKHDTEEISLSMVEAHVCKKLRVSESNVKLKLSDTPLLLGCDEKCAVCDDEDLCGYLLSLDKENRRCILFVEVIKRSKLPEKLSRAGKRSSLGMNYEVWHSNEDEIGDKAITLYGGDNQFDKKTGDCED
uniref:MULE transposase N-terminal all-beta domain-containing protein n=1 Tax=Brassica oleracea TaxID=3712 RepID=A0A3P6CWS4_BRAOL|nr:unnamed protein product [Brassica oleracea]